MMTYGRALRTLMARQGVSQIELARRLDTTRGYVSQLMSDTIREPKLGRSYQIAEALGVTLDDFTDLMFGGE